MLTPLGLSLTSVTLPAERLFCLNVFSGTPDTSEMISSSASYSEEAGREPQHAQATGWWFSEAAAV